MSGDRDNSGKVVGFIGLGVMGAPMCRHIATKRATAGVARVLAFDCAANRLAALADDGIAPAESVADLARAADQIHLCLPGGAELAQLCIGDAGLLAALEPATLVVDHGTSPVALTRHLAEVAAGRGASYADAPITRTRAAAESGTLAVLFGGDDATYVRAGPVIRCFASDIVRCGGLSTGQVVKQMNNMVLFETVVALAEAMATGRRAGVEPQVLLKALAKGSADSFALRNHGMKALLPDAFPERAFSTRYALKDLDYAIELAASVGLSLSQAEATRNLLRAAIEAGDGDAYFPVLKRVVDRG